MRFLWETPALDEAVRLAAEGFKRPIDPVLIEDVRGHLQDAEFCLCVRDETGWLVGYMLFTIPLPDVLYIAGTLIATEHQGTGIKTHGTVLAFERFPHLRWFAGRTQSSIVWASIVGISKQRFPNPLEIPLSQDGAARLVALVRALHMTGPVQEGFYGSALYGEKPLHRDPAAQAWWDTLIHFERGDALLYLARFARPRSCDFSVAWI